MASPLNTSLNLKEVNRKYDYLLVQSDEEVVSEKDEPLNTKAATVKKTVPRRKTGSSTMKATGSGSINLKNKSSAISEKSKRQKIMPKASNDKKLSTKEMIINAISELNDKKGSSSVAIRKYLVNNYDVNQQRLVRVTKLLRSANAEGWLVQTSGFGASAGSYFKLPIDTKANPVGENKKVVKAKVPTKKKLSVKVGSSKVNKTADATNKKNVGMSKKRKRN